MFIDEMYSSPPMGNFSTNKISYNHNNGMWSIDLVDMIE